MTFSSKLDKALVDEDSFEKKIPKIIEKVKKCKSPKDADLKAITDRAFTTLKDPSRASIEKYLTLRLIKECMDSKSVAFASLLATSKVYTVLEELSAFESESQQDDRGQRLFGKSEDDQTYGFMFLQMLLESVTVWAQKFPNDANKKPSRFKNHFETLKAAGVKFPDVFMFYQNGNSTPVSRLNNSSAPSTYKEKEQVKQIGTAGSVRGEDILEELKEQSIITNLSLTENFEDLPWDTFERIETKLNGLKPKFEKMIMDMFSGENPDFNEKSQELAFASKDFIDTFATEFNSLKRNSNSTQYYQFFASITDQINNIKRLYGKDFSTKKPAHELLESNRGLASKRETFAAPILSETRNSQGHSKGYSSNIPLTQTMNMENSYRNISEVPAPSYLNKPFENEQKSHFRETSEYSHKSNFQGSKSNRQNLEIPNAKSHYSSNKVQKEHIKIPNLDTSKRPDSHRAGRNIQSPNFGAGVLSPNREIHRTEFSENFSDISASNMSFSAADFPYKNKELPFDFEKYGMRVVTPGFKFFSGEFNHDGVERNLKRFKLACLKEKSAFFENDFLQIGTTTTPFFDYVARRGMLKQVLFIGNKTPKLVNSIEISFTGDKNTCLFVKEDLQPGEILPKHQKKTSLILGYNKIPFTMPTLHIKGIFDTNTTFHIDSPLPLLITKFMNFKETDRIAFRHRWSIKKKEYIVIPPFELDPRVARNPTAFLKYFPQFIELTSLLEFKNQQKADSVYTFKVPPFVSYTLAGIFELSIPDIEFLIKIVIRPNMTVVVKVASFKSYIEEAKFIGESMKFLLGI